MIEIILTCIIAVLLGVILYLIWQFNGERKELIAAVLSKSLPEYAMSMEKLKTSPKDKLKQMKAENDLALAAENLLNQADGKGITVT